jgi:hypothetical protein
VEEDFFDHELKEFKVRMKLHILEVFSPLISFLDAYDRKKGHNMLALMFDPRFKSMKLITNFWGHENVVVIIVEYDQ